MKTPALLILTVLAMGAVVCFGQGQQTAKEQLPKLRDCIEFPATPLAQPALDKIINKLQRANAEQNYRIRVWNRGKPANPIGALKIDRAEMVETDAYAKKIGLTSITIQVGDCRQVPISCNPDCTQRILGSQLITDILEILQKYND